MKKWVLVSLITLASSVNLYSLEVGAAKRKITPQWEGVPLAGYGTGRFAFGIHDDLWVTSCVLTENNDTLVFLSFDLIGLLFDEVESLACEIEKIYRIPKSNIFIASTHTHSGPDTIGLWGGKVSGKDPLYLFWVRQQAIDSVEESLKNRQMAALKFGKIRFPNPIEDARPPRVINDTLLTMQVLSQEGKTIVTLVNYAMHAEVLDQKNRKITSDYPGVLREELEKSLGGISIFFAADIGGMQTPKLLFHNFFKRKKIGKSLALQAIRSLKDAPIQSHASLRIVSKEILFPIENKRFLDSLNAGLFGNLKDHLIVQADVLYIPSRINVAQLGHALFVSIPGEFFPESGNRLRKNLEGDFLFLIGLCNNEIGYIVPEEEWNPQGYEEMMSLGPKTEGILLETVFNLASLLRLKP